MLSRPIAAFVFSFVGGIITVLTALVTINTWFYLSSTVGDFFYSSPLLNNVPSGQAIILFVVGAISGILIIIGALLQYSGRESSVRTGSLLALGAIVLAAPGTFFGNIFGGLLATMGVILGLRWKQPSHMASSKNVGLAFKWAPRYSCVFMGLIFVCFSLNR